MNRMKFNKKVFSYLISYAILIIITVVLISPYIIALNVSLRSPQNLFDNSWIPKPIYFKNYITAFLARPFLKYYINTFIYTFGIVIGQILIGSMAGFAFAFLRFRWKNIIFIGILLTMMIPIPVTIIPTMLQLKIMPGISNSGWLSTFQGLIIPQISAAFVIYLFRQFFYNIPKDLIEAARIDGASFFRIYFKIAVPLVKPGIVTTAILVGTWAWNDYIFPLFVAQQQRMYVVSIGLQDYLSEKSPYWNLFMAASITAIIPILILFIIFQKQFIKSIALTGFK